MALLRAALTQTVNAYPDMPRRREGLARLEGKLAAVREANLERHAALVKLARAQGARIVCLGELFSAPYFALGTDPMWLALAEDAREGPSARAMRKTAAELGVILIAPILERDAASGKRFNTAVVIDEKGRVLGTYRKTHIPRGANERGRFNETFYYEPGDGRQNAPSPAILGSNSFFPVFKTSAARIGVAICYDRHFPGAVSSLAQGGAQVIFSPAVTFGEKSRRLWELEFPVDACRHRVFIGGSNRRGVEKPWNQRYFGASYFAGPDGGKLKNLSKHPELVVSDLDLGSLKRPDPSGWNLARDARPGIYSKNAA